MKKYLIPIFTVFLLLNSVVYASGAVKLIDYLVSSSGLIEILAKNGVKGSDAKQIESYVLTSIGSFSDGKVVTQAELKEALAKIPMTGEDAKMKKELQLLFDKSDKEIKKEDLVKAVNSIIYLANKRGKAVIIACSDCVNENLAKQGFKFTVENIKNSTSVKLLNDIIPNSPKALNAFIASKVKRLGLGDYAKVTVNYIRPEDEKTFALFLGLYENGAPEFKELGNTIKNLSTKNGKTNIFDPADPNKLWKIVSSDISAVEAAKMAETLKEVDALAKKENIKIEEAFNKVLRKKSESSEELFSKFKAIKSKRCFFK